MVLRQFRGKVLPIILLKIRIPCHSERSEESRAGTENYTAGDFARFFANAQKRSSLAKGKSNDNITVFFCYGEIYIITINKNHRASYRGTPRKLPRRCAQAIAVLLANYRGKHCNKAMRMPLHHEPERRIQQPEGLYPVRKPITSSPAL